MKLFEIPDYLNKKVRKNFWGNGSFIYFKNGLWVTEGGASSYSPTFTEVNTDYWEEYQEPETLKRYWLWILSYDKSVSYFKTGQYVNDIGMTSLNDKYTENWEKYRKQKLVNDWIEINDNGELVNWSNKND